MAQAGLSRPGLSRSLRELADATFDIAGAADGPCESWSVLGRDLAVRFSSPALRDAFAPAWSDLPGSTGEPAATIHVLDADSAGDPPAPPWPADAYAPRDEITGFGDASLEVAFQLGTGTLVLWDSAARRGIFWTRSAAQIPLWERAMPLRIVLRWALRDLGLALVHGAAVGSQDGLALLVGPGGSGKSTLALAALEVGWTYVSDDYCAVDPVSLQVAPVTGFAKVTDGTLRLLPGLADRSSGGLTPDGKHVLRVEPAGSGRIATVVLPQVAAAASAPVPASAARTMAALAPTSLLQLPGSRAQDRELLSAVVRAVPGWSLASGPRLDETLGHLSGLLA